MIGNRFLLGVFLVLLAAHSVRAQDRTDTSPPSTTSKPSRISTFLPAFPRLPSLDDISLQAIKITPSFKLGYQRMGMTMNVPVPFILAVKGADRYTGNTADLRLPDVNLWIGEAGLEARFSPYLKAYVNGSGNLVQNLFASFSGNKGTGIDATVRKQHPLEWMEIETGAVYNPWDHIGLITGLRWDRFDLTIKDPGSLTKVHVGTYTNLSLLASDVISELWIPYLGLEVRTKNLKASLIGTLYAPAKVRVCTRLRADILSSYQFLGESTITLKTSAVFVESNAEYKIRLSNKTRLSFWGKAGWLGARGGGRLESGYSTTHSGLSVGIGDDRRVIFGRYNLAAGMAVKMSF
jgi:hypothetical protein